MSGWDWDPCSGTKAEAACVEDPRDVFTTTSLALSTRGFAGAYWTHLFLNLCGRSRARRIDDGWLALIPANAVIQTNSILQYAPTLPSLPVPIKPFYLHCRIPDMDHDRSDIARNGQGTFGMANF